MTRPRRSLWCIAALCAALLVAPAGAPTVAWADGPTAAEQKRAARLILEGNRAKDRGDTQMTKRRTKRAMASYREAVLAYLEAYSLIEHPALLLRLAEVYLARGETEWAHRGFTRYLRLDPDGPGAERAQAAREELAAELAAAREAGTELPAGDPELDPTAAFGFPEPDRPPAKEEPEDEPWDEPETDEPDETLEPLAPPPARPGRALRLGGMATAGAGAIVFAVGLKFGADARSAASTLSNKEGAWTAEDQLLVEDGRRANSRMITFTLLGTATIAAGGALYYLGHRAQTRAQGDAGAEVVIVPHLDGSGATIAIGGRF